MIGRFVQWIKDKYNAVKNKIKEKIAKVREKVVNTTTGIIDESADKVISNKTESIERLSIDMVKKIKTVLVEMCVGFLCVAGLLFVTAKVISSPVLTAVSIIIGGLAFLSGGISLIIRGILDKFEKAPVNTTISTTIIN